MNKIKVSLAQLTPELGDKSRNLQHIEDAIKVAKVDQADLIVFPELFLTGYSVAGKVEEMAETAEGESIKVIQAMCKGYGIHSVISFVEKGSDGRNYISSALIDNHGKLLEVYRKIHLFDREKEVFASGEEFKVVNTSLGKIGLMICFDVEFPEISRALKIMGADFIVIANANMEEFKTYHNLYAKSRAMENELPVIICNRLGQEGELVFGGDSMVIDSVGTVLLEMGSAEEVSSVELVVHSELNPQLNYIKNRREDLYSVLTRSPKF